MKKKFLLLTVMAFFGFAMKISAQSYCSPTFANGCTSWYNQSVTLDSIQWTGDAASCTNYDFTSMHTTLFKGVAKSMTVVNGSWCGVGVWIDYNSDGTFDNSENLYYSYQAAATQTYNFTITVPGTVANGTYRMRVVAGWGTDCFNVSSNGYGPCGSYQYGNYDDFKVRITDQYTGINENNNNTSEKIVISPNPALNQINVHADKALLNSGYTITDQIGNIVKEGKLISENSTIDLSGLAPGIYFFSNGYDLKKAIKVLKK